MARTYKGTEVRKQEILLAARRLIISRGSEHLTVRNIAREIDLTEAAIYRHFRTKQEILLFLSDSLTEHLVADLQKAACAEQVTLRTVDRALRRHLSAIEQRRGVSFLILSEILSFGDEVLNRRTAGNLERYIRQLADLLARGTAGVRLHADVKIEAAATMLFGMIQSLVSLWALNAYGFDLLRRYAELWKVFSRALGAGE